MTDHHAIKEYLEANIQKIRDSNANCLGKGAYGSVYQINVDSYEPLVIKFNTDRDEIFKKAIGKEVQLYTDMKLISGFNNIFMFYQEVGDHNILVFSKKLISASKYISKLISKPDFQQELIDFSAKFMNQLCLLHLKYLHNDIKLDNILVDEENGEVYITDFGSQCLFPSNKFLYAGSISFISKSVCNLNRQYSIDDIIAFIKSLARSIDEKQHSLIIENNKKLYEPEEKNDRFRQYVPFQTLFTKNSFKNKSINALYYLINIFLDNIVNHANYKINQQFYEDCKELIKKALLVQNNEDLNEFIEELVQVRDEYIQKIEEELGIFIIFCDKHNEILTIKDNVHTNPPREE